MACPNCGAQLPDANTTTCPQCGAMLAGQPTVDVAGMANATIADEPTLPPNSPMSPMPPISAQAAVEPETLPTSSLEAQARTVDVLTSTPAASAPTGSTPAPEGYAADAALLPPLPGRATAATYPADSAYPTEQMYPAYPAYNAPPAPTAPYTPTELTLPGTPGSTAAPVEVPAAPALPTSSPPKRRHVFRNLLLGVLVLVLVAAGGVGAYAISHNTSIYQSTLKGSLDGWENGSDCAEKADGYHIMNGTICYVPIDSQTNTDITVTVKQVGGQPDLFYGIVLRSTPQTHYYLFGIDAYGKWVFVNAFSTNQLPTPLVRATLDSAVHAGLQQSNTLEVRATGAQFEFLVNGIKVGQLTDAKYASGNIGLSGEDGIEVVYTNLSINKIQ